MKFDVNLFQLQEEEKWNFICDIHNVYGERKN